MHFGSPGRGLASTKEHETTVIFHIKCCSRKINVAEDGTSAKLGEPMLDLNTEDVGV